MGETTSSRGKRQYSRFFFAGFSSPKKNTAKDSDSNKVQIAAGEVRQEEERFKAGMRDHVRAADAELFIDGGDCADMEALKRVLKHHLAHVTSPRGEEAPWIVSVDLSHQNWCPTPEEEKELAIWVNTEKRLIWGRILLPETQREPVFPQLEEEEPGWKDRFTDGKTALIRQNLRSGQNFYTRGNVVILGDVNPGAEIVAGGSILVVGTLRGMAHAGRFGNEKKVVAALKMQPIQIRIAEHITRPPDGEREEGMFPEVARIRDGRVIIETMVI